jgi:negative regulator of replication initiation
MATAIATTRTTTIMSTYKTAVQVDSEVHEYLFSAKERPGESFNSAIRRELGMPAPDGSDDADSEDSESEETEARERVRGDAPTNANP